MATINEILHKIKERDTSFNITDDYRIADEIIISMMNDIRATLIREEKNNKGFVPPEYYQLNCCYEINCIEGSCEYNGETIPDGQSIYTVKMKSHVKGLGSQAIKFIGNRSGTISFSQYSFQGYNSMEGRVWTKNTKAATIIGDELRLKNLPTEGMKFICLLEVLEDPRTACDWVEDKSDYPVPSETKLVDMVLYRLMVSGRLPADKLNNAADDIVPPQASAEAVGMQQRLQTEGSRPQSQGNQKQQ